MNCQKLKNTYFNYAYNLRYLDFIDCPSLSGKIYVDNCDLMYTFIASNSNIKTVTFSDKAKLIGFISENCPLRSIYMPATGVESLTRSATYSIVPDQIEAGTFMIAAVASQGDILIQNCITKHLDVVTAKLEEIGATIEDNGRGIPVDINEQVGRPAV